VKVVLDQTGDDIGAHIVAHEHTQHCVELVARWNVPPPDGLKSFHERAVGSIPAARMFESE
jgi:hypothetical protein